ncbi:hypothetical protein [Mycobacterium uberis]|uniref:hypothetical protein n=1 Tax=Mycobacterium uberis TaxID=2162698 RepID=UPI001FB47A16|nr:hypothetical protein [Mycobacterium uberis]
MRFAIQNQELYGLVTVVRWRSRNNVDITLDSSAFEHVCVSAQTLMDEGVYRTNDPTTITLELWRATHGVAAPVDRQATL